MNTHEELELKIKCLEIVSRHSDMIDTPLQTKAEKCYQWLTSHIKKDEEKKADKVSSFFDVEAIDNEIVSVQKKLFPLVEQIAKAKEELKKLSNH